MAAQCFDSGSRRTATLGLCDPQNAIRFRPTVPNREVFQQAGEKAVRFSIRSCKALLSSGFATCTLWVALLGGVLPLRIISRREPRNQALDRTLSCSQAMGYYGMDRSGQFGISAAEVLGKSRNRPAGRFRNGPSDKSGDRSGGVLREGTMTAVAQRYTPGGIWAGIPSLLTILPEISQILSIQLAGEQPGLPLTRLGVHGTLLYGESLAAPTIARVPLPIKPTLWDMAPLSLLASMSVRLGYPPSRAICRWSDGHPKSMYSKIAGISETNSKNRQYASSSRSDPVSSSLGQLGAVFAEDGAFSPTSILRIPDRHCH